MERNIFTQPGLVVTAGSTYLDIDAYACAMAMAELLQLQGKNAIAYSSAPYNYSVCSSLIEEGQIHRSLPDGWEQSGRYIIVDVSDPGFLKQSVPMDRVVAVYDHHIGFEEYWASRIGDGAHIEFIGAAATLIYREWKKAGLQEQMRPATAQLLLAAILDNTLNLTSSNTTPEDRSAFAELCAKANIDDQWCAAYFSEVQASVESDLKNALFHDIKFVRDNAVLPQRIAQLCVWSASSVLEDMTTLRALFADCCESWMINIIDIQHQCSYFVCDDFHCQKQIEQIFNIEFKFGVAKTDVPYLRKEIIKKTLCG